MTLHDKLRTVHFLLNGNRNFYISVIFWIALIIAIKPPALFAKEIEKVKPEDTQLAIRMAKRDADLEPPFEFSINAGYRVDNFEWSVAVGDVNPGSELEWQNTKISQVQLNGRFRFSSRWYFGGTYSSGSVISGDNRDSDFAGSGRTKEYSRSIGDTGGTADDASIGLGVKILQMEFSETSRLVILPWVGISMHLQSLIMFNGQRTIPFDAPINNLQNNYDTEWQGGWTGLDSSMKFSKRIMLRAMIKGHLVDYKAKANWNLRNDFSHPLSFRHDAKGKGRVISLTGSYNIYPHVAIYVAGNYQKWSTWNGIETTFYSSGITEYNFMNAVKFDSKTIALGVLYQF